MPRADQHRTYHLSRDQLPLELRAAPGLLNLRLGKKLTQTGLPALTGNPIHVSIQPTLVAYRGRLLSGDSFTGSAVYAAAFLRERRIILEAGLLSNAQTFRLILIHELFHFVWLRLGNNARSNFSGILFDERKHGARGELGESSAVRKESLCEGASFDRWRDYVCESFCDTAAWLYSGVDDGNLFTLRRRWRERRKAWFEAASKGGAWKC